MADTSPAQEHQGEVTQRQVLTAGFASVLAWAFDLFDLFILLYVASAIAPLFFPTDSTTLSLAAVYASFAVSLLMRPLGAAVFGNYADRNGRKRAMTVAIFGVGIFTFLMGTVPTIAQIGILAPIIFLALRIVQGLFVGGVVASTHTIGTETAPERWRGLMSGAVGGAAAGLGALIASFAFLIISSIFPGEAFSVWGWRFMFFTGIIAALLSFFIFRAVQESPLWERQERRQQERSASSPLRTIFSSRRERTVFLKCLMLSTGGGSLYYLTAGFLPTFLAEVNQAPNIIASQILIISSFVMLVATPFVGHVSQLIGRKRTFLITGVSALIVVPLVYVQLSGLPGDSRGYLIFYAVVLTFIAKSTYSPLIIFLNERFPTAIRASGTGLNWNMGFAIGGILPTFVTLASPSVEDIPSRVIAFSVGAVLLFLAGALLNPETKGNLDTVPETKGA